ncbi:hypothetical protein B0H11DRAFT_2274892 [Mycena galericulata]|nr:hypothetical protein B0H11DRAFT_2203780 [Mycena galericulata]KAJ7501986.1 hypothetical protein B0H11DRAFT_2274892 [Mycena galericulata]
MPSLKSGIPKLDALGEANRALQAENSAQRKDLDAVQAAIARLEIVAAPPLVLRARSPERRLNLHAPSRRGSRSPPAAQYPKNQHLSRPRSRSRSPPGAQLAKRPRREDGKGFISVGPIGESAETNRKFFELHLRTAIPKFRLDSPYDVEADPAYKHNYRITVTSNAVARALIEAWGKNTVIGYANIKMFQMAGPSGTERTLGDSKKSATPGSNSTRSHQDYAPRASTSHNQARYSEPSRR